MSNDSTDNIQPKEQRINTSSEAKKNSLVNYWSRNFLGHFWCTYSIFW